MFSLSSSSVMNSVLRARRLHLLCSRFSDVASDNSNGEQEVLVEIGKPKTSKFAAPQIVSPIPSSAQIEDWNTIVGVNLAASTVSWATVSMPDMKVEGVSSTTWLPNPNRILPSEILESATSIADNIPPASVYVFNKSMWKRPGAHITTASLNFMAFGSMLVSLLNGTHRWEEKGHKIFYMENYSFSKLYQLRIGDEQISSQHVIHDMLIKSGDSVWLPHVYGVHYSEARKETPYSIPKWAGTAIDQLWVRDDVRRENLCNAVLITLAFIDLACLKTPSALKFVMAKTPRRVPKKNSLELVETAPPESKNIIQ